MGLTLVTPAASSPVSLADARAICKRDDTADDVRIQMLLDAAVPCVEDFIGKAIGAQVWLLCLDRFADEIELPRGPVIGIDSIIYLDEDGAEQALDPDNYTLDLVSVPQRIVRNSEASWPVTLDRVNAIEIMFETGYTGSSREYGLVKAAVLAMIEHWYNGGIMGVMPAGIVQMLNPQRRIVI